MTVERTDNAAMRQVFIWKGPVNSPWPFDASGRAWALGTVLVPTLTAAVFTAAWVPLRFAGAHPAVAVVVFVLSVATGTFLGVRWVRAIGRHLTPTRPMRHLLALFLAQLDAPRDQGPSEHLTTVPGDLWAETRGHAAHLTTTTHLGDR